MAVLPLYAFLHGDPGAVWFSASFMRKKFDIPLSSDQYVVCGVQIAPLL
jgi:hypothetical protein